MNTNGRESETDELLLLAQPGREEDLRMFLLQLHSSDVAELVSKADEATAKAILKQLDSERTAELLSELDPAEQEQLLALVRPEQLGPIVGEMETDDVTDLLQELDSKTAEQVLATLPAEERKDVKRLMRYPPDTAGGIMQTELVAVTISSTVESAIQTVRREAKDIDILSLFVVDDGGHYAGHVALQKLVLFLPDTAIEQIMDPKTAEVRVDVDQEEVARVFDRYSLVEVGVVDQAGCLVGRITADDIHEVLVEEAEEDMLIMAGTAAQPDVIYSKNLARIVWLRLPWLLPTGLAGLLASYIMQTAGKPFQTILGLAFFVPVITGMSGNIGTQSAMIMLRGMALGHVRFDELYKDILRDLAVCAIMAFVCGTLVAVVVTNWQQSLVFGACVGTSLFASMLTAGVLGAVEPPLLQRVGVDPAVAAGPLITSINDVTGVLIYTLLATLFFGLFG